MKFRLRPGSVARAEDLVGACVRECAAYVAVRPENGPLVAAIGALVVEYAAHEPDADRCFGALLTVGRRALDAGEVRLARRVADSAVALRSRSGEAWWLRGRALEADGREVEAVHAFTRSEAMGERAAIPVAVEAGGEMDVAAFREWLAGKSVCVVGNGEAVAVSGLGARIDEEYDVVVRVDSFQTHALGTGERLDVHAVSHRSGGPAWRRQAQVRLVFAERPEAWREAVGSRVVAGAQTWLGGPSLARPLRDAELIGEAGWAAEAGTAFTVVRLIDHLGGCTRLDLVGLTLPGALRPEERQWVLRRARRTEGIVVSLR